MKNYKFFIYLFALAVLYIIFQQVNAKKKFESDAVKIESLTHKVEKLKKQNDSLDYELGELIYFDLKYDDYGSEYLEDDGYTVTQIQELVTDMLISQNSAEKDNPFVPLAGMMGNTQIDRVKLLNHKWAIVDFTDGTYWGQVLYRYQFNKEKTLSLDVITSHLYPKH